MEGCHACPERDGGEQGGYVYVPHEPGWFGECQGIKIKMRNEINGSLSSPREKQRPGVSDLHAFILACSRGWLGTNGAPVLLWRAVEC